MLISVSVAIPQQQCCVKVSKYGPEKTPHLNTFHAVQRLLSIFK